MAIPDVDGYADLFAGLENAQAELCACTTVAALREVVAAHHGTERFDELVRAFTELNGTGEDVFLDDLRSVLTAIPYGEVLARPVPGTEEWVWAARRDTPATDWQPLDTLSVAAQDTHEFSVLDESNAIYVRVLAELGEPGPDEAGQVWQDIWAKVSDRAGSWTAESAAEVRSEVVDAFLAGLSGEESIEDVIAELQEFRSVVIAATAE